MINNVNGVAKVCEVDCAVCAGSRTNKPWLKPLVKGIYYVVCRPLGSLKVPMPCIEREKQIGKKPWE